MWSRGRDDSGAICKLKNDKDTGKYQMLQNDPPPEPSDRAGPPQHLDLALENLERRSHSVGGTLVEAQGGPSNKNNVGG